MKKFHYILLIFLFLTSGLIAQSTRKNSLLKPTNFQKRITTLVSGKTRYYYSLSAESPSVISLQGPGKLRVITRGRFKPGEADKIGYEVLYTIDGGDTKKFTASDVVRSKSDTYSDGKLGVPGLSKDFELELGRGDHSIEFKILGDKIPVAARYIFTPSKEKKQDWIAFSPLRPSEPVDLITKESAVCYYRFSKAKPLKFEVNGPTELRVLTRIENHFQMKGRIQYRVQVLENSKVINTYQLSSESSDVTYYKDNKELIPGKGCEFVVNVPKGRHIYEVFPLDEDKSTLLGRLLLPKKDVKLEY